MCVCILNIHKWCCRYPVSFFFSLTTNFSLIKKFFLFFGHTTCGILVPRPGIKPLPLALEGQSLDHWTSREVPLTTILKTFYYAKISNIFKSRIGLWIPMYPSFKVRCKLEANFISFTPRPIPTLHRLLWSKSQPHIISSTNIFLWTSKIQSL